jgi:hypothetical protein
VSPKAQRVSSVLWPSFLMAAVMEIVVFASVDPGELHWVGEQALPMSDATVYSLAFFVFWAVIGAACLLTLRLLLSAEELNTP